MSPTDKRNFHVPLPPDLYDALKAESARLQTPATTLAREAIGQWLEAQRRQVLADAIEAYAEDVAGSDDDLAADLEAAAEEALTEAPK